MKKLTGMTIILLIICAGIYGFNYLNLNKPIRDFLTEDSRNEVANVQVNYKYYIIPNTLVFNLEKVSEDAAAIDVFRILLQSASALQDKEFKIVELSYKGTTKFYLKGGYFKKIGEEYEVQNPIYTMRTLPENVYNIDGTAAYEKWTGGLLGVMTEQMEDFDDFCKNWFLDDLMKEMEQEYIETK